tara:strand:- start:4041 stop:4199 length:159 start_codon:yes stop_codon:yes gene_type:complete
MNYCHECSGMGENEWCEEEERAGDECGCDDDDSHDMIECEACDGTGDAQGDE